MTEDTVQDIYSGTRTRMFAFKRGIQVHPGATVMTNADQNQTDLTDDLAPDERFKRPLDVVRRHDLSREEKVETLNQWEQLLMARLRATDEGMTPPPGKTADEGATMQEIAVALGQLDARPELPADVSNTPITGVASHRRD